MSVALDGVLIRLDQLAVDGHIGLAEAKRVFAESLAFVDAEHDAIRVHAASPEHHYDIGACRWELEDQGYIVHKNEGECYIADAMAGNA